MDCPITSETCNGGQFFLKPFDTTTTTATVTPSKKKKKNPIQADVMTLSQQALDLLFVGDSKLVSHSGHSL